MKKFLIITIIFIFQSFPSLGEWKEIGGTINDDVFYIDFDKIRKIDGYIHHWTLINYSKIYKGYHKKN